MTNFIAFHKVILNCTLTFFGILYYLSFIENIIMASNIIMALYRSASLFKLFSATIFYLRGQVIFQFLYI